MKCESKDCTLCYPPPSVIYFPQAPRLRKAQGIAVLPSARTYKRVTEVTEHWLSPHGFLERIEITPLQDCPNMDASKRYKLTVTLEDGDGNPIPVSVQSVNRDVMV